MDCVTEKPYRLRRVNYVADRFKAAEKKLEVQLSNKFTYQIQWKETPHPHSHHNGGQTKTALPSQAPRQHLVSLLQVLLLK